MKARYRTRQHKAAFRKKKAAKAARRASRKAVLLQNLRTLLWRLQAKGFTFTGRIGAHYIPGERQCFVPTPPAPPATN